MMLHSNELPSATPIDILLVDDDDEDVALICKTLVRDRVLNRLFRVEDGVEAMKYLRKEKPFSEAVRPDLILLDLNMPRKDGREVLKEIKEDKEFHTIPVVVLTTSDDEADICASYNYKANSYVTKPVDLIQFRNVLQRLQDFWFSVVKLPVN